MPEERGWNRLEPKAFLAEDSQTGHIHYSPMEGDRWGRDIAFDITVMLCREIDDGPESVASLDTPENVLKAIDDMMAEFGDTEELLLMWAGDWFQIEIELKAESPSHLGAALNSSLPGGDAGRFNPPLTQTPGICNPLRRSNPREPIR